MCRVAEHDGLASPRSVAQVLRPGVACALPRPHCSASACSWARAHGPVHRRRRPSACAATVAPGCCSRSDSPWPCTASLGPALEKRPSPAELAPHALSTARFDRRFLPRLRAAHLTLDRSGLLSSRTHRATIHGAPSDALPRQSHVSALLAPPFWWPVPDHGLRELIDPDRAPRIRSRPPRAVACFVFRPCFRGVFATFRSLAPLLARHPMTQSNSTASATPAWFRQLFAFALSGALVAAVKLGVLPSIPW